MIAKFGEVCEDKEHDETTPRDTKCELDHIVELRDGGQPFAESNVVFRCRSCHGRKTDRARRNRANKEMAARLALLGQ
jgi:5-methylcytosine-specific restriction protein A